MNYIMGKNLENGLDRRENTNNIGVIIDNKLNWSLHINNVVNNSNKMLGLIKRSVGYSSSITTQLYVSLVRSNLEYCSPVFGAAQSRQA